MTTTSMSGVPKLPSSFLQWWQTVPGRCVAFGLLLLGTAILMGAVCQTQFGIFGSENWDFPASLKSKVRKDGDAYKVPLPKRAMGQLAEEHAVLLRDGMPVGTRVPRASTVVERGNGAFKIQQRFLYFSLPKNEDPQPGLTRLSLSVPRTVRDRVWMVGGLFFIVGGFAVSLAERARGTSGRLGDRLSGLPDAAILLTVLVFSLLVTLSRVPESLTYSDGWFSVKGMPYSDASGWDQLSVSLSRGEGFVGGFSAQRPLYPAMLGVVYAVTGPSLFAAKVLNAIWLALAATGACAIGIFCGSRLAGVGGALGLLISADQRMFSYLLMTETVGLTFGIAAVLALCAALRRPVWWLVVMAGLLLACASLASGFGLFAVVGYGLVALLAWWHKLGFKKSLQYSFLLAGVVALAWAPWVIRQKVVHGILNLSSSGAVLMYATADAEHGGQFSVESAGEWKTQNIPNTEGARYDYYMRKYKETVKAHPVAYVKAVLHGMDQFAGYFTLHGPANFGSVVLVLGLAAFLMMLRHPPWAVLPALAVVVAVCCLLEGMSGTPLWILSCVILLLTGPPEKRFMWALVAVTPPFVALVAGITGGNFGRRMWTCCTWTMFLLLSGAAMASLKGLTALMLRWRKSAAASAVCAECRTNPFLVRFSVVLSALLLGHAAVGSLAVTTLWLTHRNLEALALPQGVKAEALQEISVRFGQAARPDALCVGVMQFGEYAFELKGWEDVNHWSRSFAMRPYSRTVAFGMKVDGIASSPMACQLRWPTQDLPRDVPLLVIGVKNEDVKALFGHEAVLTEVLAFAPVNRSDSALSVDWDKLSWVPPADEALNILGLPVKK